MSNKWYDGDNYGEIVPLAISEFSTVERREMRGLISELKLEMKFDKISPT